MFKFIPIWGFDFKVIIDNHVVAISPGEHIVIPIRLELIRGKPQDVDLDVTKWESVGLTASIHFSSFVPGHPWKASLMIRSSSNTPPDSYLFTVRGSAKGTFHTSEDAVTVIIKPKDKDKQKSDEKNSSQPQQFANTVGPSSSPNFDLDKLFTPKDGNIPPDGRSPLKPTKAAKPNNWPVWILIIGAIVGGIIFAIVLSGGGGTPSKSSSTGCPTTCPYGIGVTIPKRCPCPAACPYTYTEDVKGGGLPSGYKQCANRPAR